MKRFLANQKGSSYLYVIITFSILFLILSSCIELTHNQVQSTDSSLKNNNMYYLALSGAEKMVDMLNRSLYLNSTAYLDEISSEISKKIADDNFKSYINYKIGNDCYDGKSFFHFVRTSFHFLSVYGYSLPSQY